MHEQLTPEQKQQIDAALLAGRKIEAIKLLREATGLGLAEAKQAVEEYQPTVRSDALSKGLAPDQEKEIQACIIAGKKIEAIKLLREATGLGLKEAKDAVEEYEVTLRQKVPGQFKPAAKGCMSCLVLLLVVAISLSLLVWKTLE